jgi:hypothetical protein
MICDPGAYAPGFLFYIHLGNATCPHFGGERTPWKRRGQNGKPLNGNATETAKYLEGRLLAEPG